MPPSIKIGIMLLEVCMKRSCAMAGVYVSSESRNTVPYAFNSFLNVYAIGI